MCTTGLGRLAEWSNWLASASRPIELPVLGVRVAIRRSNGQPPCGHNTQKATSLKKKSNGPLAGANKTFFSFFITGHYLGVLLVFFWGLVTGSKEQRSAKRRPHLEPPAPRGAPFPPAAAPPPTSSILASSLPRSRGWRRQSRLFRKDLAAACDAQSLSSPAFDHGPLSSKWAAASWTAPPPIVGVGVFVSCSFCFLSQAIIWAFYWVLMAAPRVSLTPAP
jgi:hypothetical protein